MTVCHSMNIQISTTSAGQVDADWLIVPAVEKFAFDGELGALNTALGGQIERLREMQDFTGKVAETLVVPAPLGIGARRLLLVGLGASDKLTVAGLNRALMSAARVASGKPSGRVAVQLTGTAAGNLTLGQQVQLAAAALTVGCVGQDLFKSEKKRHPFGEVE
ncbi:MAG: peptidase M17, partial [Planctomycetaceae bacterium]